MSQTKDWIYAEHSQEIFRKTEFYSLNWNIENTQLVSANFGGPIGKINLFKVELLKHVVFDKYFHVENV
jgi:hypothetical protein